MTAFLVIITYPLFKGSLPFQVIETKYCDLILQPMKLFLPNLLEYYLCINDVLVGVTCVY